MNQQQIIKIKEYSEKVLELRDGVAMPPLKLIQDGHDAHWQACERNRYELDEILYRLKRDCRKKFLALLGDDANDWVFIARTFEDKKPKWFLRLDGIRQTILGYTDPNKINEYRIEPQGSKFIPDEKLMAKIKEFHNELLYVTELTNEENPTEARGGEAQKNGGQMKTESWKELSLDVIDDNTVSYKIGKANWKRTNYVELGFQDKRKGLPNKLWGIFKELSQHCNSQIIEYHTPEGINISKDIDRICKILKEFFGPKDRPICYDKSNKAWKVAFKLTYKFQNS